MGTEETDKTVESVAPECYTAEEIDSADIAEYRDNYVPETFYPEPEFWGWLDISILFLLLSLAVFVFSSSQSFAKFATCLNIAAFVYFGIIRGGCICPVGALANITVGVLNPGEVPLMILAIFLIPLAFALLAGRVFCSAGCPIGAVQQIFAFGNTIKIPVKVLAFSRIFPCIVLVATIIFAGASSFLLICALDPYKTVFFAFHAVFLEFIDFLSGKLVEHKIVWAGGWFAWFVLTVVLLVGTRLHRPFCRFICPYGVILGLLSLISFMRRQIAKSDCVRCGKCAAICPVQAIRHEKGCVPSISNYDCIQCGKCSALCKKISGLKI